MKYTIEFVFDAEDDPPTVEVYDSSGMSVMEIFEEPTLIVPYWSDSFRDWEPGPFTIMVLGLLNAPEVTPTQHKQLKEGGACGVEGCTFYNPVCERHVEEHKKALANGMPPSGRHG